MAYRDILVQINEAPTSAARAADAAGLAARCGAQLTGVFLKSEFPPCDFAGEGYTYLTSSDLDRIMTQHAEAVTQRAETARQLFEAAARAAGVASDWQVIDGDTSEDLVACARRFDLTVMPTKAYASLGQHAISAAELALGSGGPVLVLPQATLVAPAMDRVLVAWSGSRESARAVRDAWPLLEQAKEVHLLTVTPHGDGGPDGYLQRHFERHGLKANLIVDRRADLDASAILRGCVSSLQIDLVVMGLYGRPRLQELVLGGVSHDLLAHPPTPLLVSH